MTWRVAVWTAALSASGLALQHATADAQETTRLRAGEHSGYSRLAIDLESLEGWTVREEGRRLIVRFPGRGIEFDTRQIFPQRRVSRVTSASGEISQDGTTLTLALSCDCRADAYEFTDTMLVIDVRPRSDPRSTVSRPPPPRPSARRGDDVASSSAPVPEAEAETAETQTPAPASYADPIASEPAEDQTASASEDEAPQFDAVRDVEEAQRALLRQLSRAVDQGLVNLRSPEAPIDRAATPQPQAAPARDTVAEPVPDPGLAAAAARSTSSLASEPAPDEQNQSDPTPGDRDQMQIRAMTAFDDRRGRVAPSAEVRTCPSDDWLRAASWGEDEDFYGQLSALRATLVEEFDRPSPAAALDLARLYIRFGFGAEALQALEKNDLDGTEVAMLVDAATVVDAGAAAVGGPLDRAGRCSGPTATWRLAAGLAPSPLDVAETGWRNAALTAFEELPLLLRRRLAPRVVETLVEEGHLEFADAFRARLDRAPGDHGRRWDLAVARLLFAQDEIVRGEALLRRAAEARDDVGAEALLELAERALAQDGALDAEVIERLASESASRDGTLLGRRLLVAELFGRAGRHELREVLDLIALEKETRAGRKDDLDAALRAVLKEADANHVGEAAYAAAVLAHASAMGTTPPWDSTRLVVARELTAIGLGNVAQDVLAPVIARGGADGRVAAASAQIALGRPSEALLLLQPVESELASRVESEALAADGRHEAALARLGRIEENDAALAWRAGAWSQAAELGDDPGRRDLARWMAGEERLDPAPSEPALDATREALERSQDLRKRIMEALEDG
ncbi:MAG: hypothetical protein AAGI51_01320 [Pseudomonadota bacterium]